MKTYKDYLAESTSENLEEVIEFLRQNNKDIAAKLSDSTKLVVVFEDAKEYINSYDGSNRVALISTNMSNQMTTSIWDDVRIFCEINNLPGEDDEWLLSCVLYTIRSNNRSQTKLFDLLVPEDGKIRIVNQY